MSSASRHVLRLMTFGLDVSVHVGDLVEADLAAAVGSVDEQRR